MIPTKPHRALWRLATALLAAMPAAGAWSAAQAEEVSQAQIANKRCLECHGQPKMADYPPGERRTMLAPSTQPAAPNAPAKRPGLYVLPSFAAGAHAKLACTDCHKLPLAPGETLPRLPHAMPVGPATCTGDCHDTPQTRYTHAKADSDYLQGAHAQAVAKGTPNAPTCSYCHGGHDVLPKSDRRSRTHPLNVISLCVGPMSGVRAATIERCHITSP